MLRRTLIIILLLFFSNAAYGDTIEYPSTQENIAAQIASLKGSASGDLQSQLALASMYSGNSAGTKNSDEAARWYEKAFFRGDLEQLIGARSDKIGHMKMWWHITTYIKIIQNKPDADSAFKLSYMNALLLCNDENGPNYYEALNHANLAQSYNRSVVYASRAEKISNFLVKRIRQEQRMHGGRRY